MKTRRQKVVLKYIRKYMVILTCILLCASFFVMPVSAEIDSLNSVTFENYDYIFGGNIYAGEYCHPVVRAGYFPSSSFDSLNNLTCNSDFLTSYISPYNYKYGNGHQLEFYDIPSNSTLKIFIYINQIFDDNVWRDFFKNDTFMLKEGWVSLYFGPDTTISDYRFTIRNFGDEYFGWGAVAAYTDVVSCSLRSGFAELEYDTLPFTFREDVYSNSLCLCLELTATIKDNYLIVGTEFNEYTILYGSGVSPNYPIYPDAPGGNEVNDYASKEQQLVDSQQQGLSQGANSISNTNSFLSSLNTDLKLMSFVPVLSGMLDRLATIPGVMPIVQISLALGLFASLLGMAGAIVSAADRKAAREKREAARAARSDKKK